MLIAISICISLVLLYVISLYLIPKHIQLLSRDDPLHISYRMSAVTIATCVDWIICYFLYLYAWSPFSYSNSSIATFIEVIGFRLDTAIMAILSSGLLMGIFYLGPIVTWLAYIFTIQSYELTRTGNLVRREKDLPVFVVMKTELKGMVAGYSSQLILRNLIIAPITEEILFRALLTPTLFATYPSTQIAEVSRISTTVLVLGCPAFFAVAHLHHLYEKIRSGTKLVNALIQVLIQASYTYIFGCISMLLFIRTGSVFACITSHVICNFMGLPDTSFMNAVSYHGQYSVLYSYRFILLLLHGLGLVLFSFMLYPLITSFPTVYLSQ